MTALLAASATVWQWPAVMITSASTRVTEHVETYSFGGAPWTVTIMPHAFATRERTSFASVTLAMFSQLGGGAQNQKGS